MDPGLNKGDKERIETQVLAIKKAMVLIQMLLAALFLIPLYMFMVPQWEQWKLENKAIAEAEARMRQEKALQKEFDSLWKAPSEDSTSMSKEQWMLVKYGKELVSNTSYYLGPHGTIKSISNGMNCQNCHLEAGTKPWGNNYGAVVSTYPKYRARSGSIEDISKRVNDCMERSLNGTALTVDSREMKAFIAYIEYLGKDVEKGKKPSGSGIFELPLPEKELDTMAGKTVYLEKCASCHQQNGRGLLASDEKSYTYPPLWGDHSYNQGAGLFRMSRFAGYVRYNMPQGASYLHPQLTDEEAWNVAGFVNSQPRPEKDITADWPKIEEKPFDHPFGPYTDPFTEHQHKYGPYKPIKEFYQKFKK